MTSLVKQSLLALLLVSCLGGSLARADDAVSDSGTVYPDVRRDRNPVEYILALPAIALQVPIKILAGIAYLPVVMVEGNGFMPRLKEALTFIDPEGIRPVVGYKSTSGLLGGLAIQSSNSFSRGIGVGLKGSYSTNKYGFAALTLGGEHWGDGPLGLVGEFGWQSKTRERFHGIGASSSLDNESNYGFRGAFGSLHGYWEVTRHLSASAFGGFRRVDPRDGRLTTTVHTRDSMAVIYDGQDLYGLFERLDLMEYGTELTHDWRDRPGSPLKGGTELLRVSYVTGTGAADTSIGFWKVRAEISHYLDLFRGRVIGVRVLAEVTEPDDWTRIPFYELAQLGGSHSLRGYRTGRFTDRDMAMITLEYRWPLWQRIDAFLFTDQGRVFHDIEDDFAFANFRSSYGGGLRIWNSRGASEIMIARSNEKVRFYLNLGAL